MHQVCHERLPSRLLEHLEHLEHLELVLEFRFRDCSREPLTPRRRAAGRCALPLDRRRPARELNRASAREEGARGSGCTRAPGEKDQNKEHCMCAIATCCECNGRDHGDMGQGSCDGPAAARCDARRVPRRAVAWPVGPCVWGARAGRVLPSRECRAQHPILFVTKKIVHLPTCVVSCVRFNFVLRVPILSKRNLYA